MLSAGLPGRLRDLTNEAYSSALAEFPSRRLLQLLGQSVRAERVLWSACQPDTQRIHVVNAFNVSPDFVQHFERHGPADSPWFDAAGRMPSPGSVWRGSQVLQGQKLLSSHYYRTLLEPAGIHHTLHLVLCGERGNALHIMLTRGPRATNFTRQEMELLRAFAVDAQTALEHHAIVSRMRMVRSGLLHMLDAAGIAFLILDPPDTIFASEHGLRVLAQLGVTEQRMREWEGVLRPSHVALPQAIAKAVAEHDLKSTTRLVLARVPTGKVIVEITPFPLRNGAQAEARVGLTVTFSSSSRGGIVDEELLRMAYDLSAVEAHICAHLLGGERVDQISARLNISPNTVRTHLKRVFDKTGCRRQAELVTLILNSTSYRRGRSPRARAPESDSVGEKSSDGNPHRASG